MKTKIELYNDHFEEWKDITNYENLYQISNLGRVRSVDRLIKQYGHKRQYERLMKGKILKLHKQNGGYMLATLTKDGKEKKMLVHRLVAQEFIPNPQNKEQVNHIDGNKQNNCIDNLEWCTQSENVKHSYSKLHHKLKNKKVFCCELNKFFNSIEGASKELNINPRSISHAINNRAKKAGGYTWRVA